MSVNGIASPSVSSLSDFFPLLNMSTSFGKYARCSICARAMLTSKVTEWELSKQSWIIAHCREPEVTSIVTSNRAYHVVGAKCSRLAM